MQFAGEVQKTNCRMFPAASSSKAQAAPILPAATPAYAPEAPASNAFPSVSASSPPTSPAKQVDEEKGNQPPSTRQEFLTICFNTQRQRLQG